MRGATAGRVRARLRGATTGHGTSHQAKHNAEQNTAGRHTNMVCRPAVFVTCVGSSFSWLFEPLEFA